MDDKDKEIVGEEGLFSDEGGKDSGNSEESGAREKHYDFDEALGKALSGDKCVTIDVLKVVTLGPPEAGKTQVKKGLLHKFDPSEESTNVAAQSTVMVQRYMESNSKWVELTLEKSTLQLSSWIRNDSTHTESGEMLKSVGVILRSPHKQDPKSQKEDEIRAKTVSSVASQRNRAKEFRQAKEHILQQLPELSRPDSSPENRVCGFRMISIIDSGGQPAFYDVHPVLASSRAIYLQVFNLFEGVQGIPRMTFRKKSFNTREVPNCFSNLDIITHSLITLGECKKKFAKMDELISPIIEESSKDVPIMLVGTHFDKCVGEKDDHIRASTEICKHCKHLKIFNEVLPLSQNSCVFPVNAHTDIDIQCIRDKINESLAGYKIRLPLKWFLCHLIFWSLSMKGIEVVQFSSLLSLCREEELICSKEEFYTMLKLFHILGLLAFPDVDTEFNSREFSPHEFPIFIKPDFLYQCVTDILDVQFRADVSGSRKRLQSEGILTLETLADLGLKDKLCGIERFRLWFVKCLIRWGLAATLKNGEFFIPSVLPSAHDNPRVNLDADGLLIAVCNEESRSYSMPMGLFPHFVSYLVRERKYEPSDTSCRNVVYFCNIKLGKQSFSLTLHDCMEFFSVSIQSESKKLPTGAAYEHFCSLFHTATMKTWKRIYHNDPDVILGVQCPCRVERVHIAKYEEDSGNVNCCAWDMTSGKNFPPKKMQKKWFHKKKASKKAVKPAQTQISDSLPLDSTTLERQDTLIISPSQQSSTHCMDPVPELLSATDTSESGFFSSSSLSQISTYTGPESQSDRELSISSVGSKRSPHTNHSPPVKRMQPRNLFDTSDVSNGHEPGNMEETPQTTDILEAEVIAFRNYQSVIRQFVADKVGTNLGALSDHLGVEVATRERFQHKYPGNLSDVAAEIIHHWAEKNIDEKPTWLVLVDAMTKSNMTAAANDMKEKLYSCLK